MDKPIESHLYTVETLLTELISGRPVLISQGKEFEIASQQSRTILNWYRDNRDRWDRPNREEDVKHIAKTLSNSPPSFPPMQNLSKRKGISRYHLKKIEISQFGGVNKFSDVAKKNDLEFEVEKPNTLFQGHNGAGKTALVSAVCWCLSGFVYRTQHQPQNVTSAIDLRIKHDGREDTVKSASIITPIPSSSYVQSLTNDRVPLNTWVKLSFIDDDDNDAGSIKRSLRWKSTRGSNIIEDVEVLGGFGLDPIALEIGTKMPGLIPYIQLDSTSDLGNAIAELTGLHAIKDLVNHAQKSKDKLTKALPKKANTEIEKINDTLRERRSNVQLKSSVALSFHPYIVPVSIRIDSDGHVELASATSLPTPIGVFVLEVTVAVEDTPMLTIIYNGEKHIYSMGTELYAFELPEYDGRITIKYDGKGNVTILLE